MNSKTYCFEAWSAEKALELEVDDNAGLCRRSVMNSYTFNNSGAYCCGIVSWKDASSGFSSLLCGVCCGQEEYSKFQKGHYETFAAAWHCDVVA